MNIRRLAISVIAAVLAATISAAAIQVFSPTTGDVNLPGITNNWPAGTYTKVVPLTGFSLTFAQAQTKMLLRPAGTLATGTVTMAALPPDGQEACIFSTQIVTALTVAANTGQTMVDNVTAMTANGRVCYTYSLANTTWNRSQ